MAPLLAFEIGELLRVLVPIVFLIIWVISQVVGEQGKRQQPVKGPRQQPGGRRPQPKGVAQGIEEFLRRAAEQRQGGRPAEVEVVRPEPAAAGRRPHAAGWLDQGSPQQGRLEPAAVDRVVEVLPSRSDIAESVESHLGSDQLGRHAEQLGDEIRDGDAEMEQRLSARFDHQVGRLESELSERPTPHAAPRIAATGGRTAAELIELLRNPRGIRTAILVSEILNRPEHRW
jgi:hypothetical protein